MIWMAASPRHRELPQPTCAFRDQAQLADLQAVATRYQDTVALFAALGGGWWNSGKNGAGAADAPGLLE